MTKRAVAAALLAAATAIALAIALPSTGTRTHTGTVTARPDTPWDNLFQGYGNLSGAWSGGDGAQSLELPDGSTTWFFADTFLGQTTPSLTRTPGTTGLAHNSAVRYRDGHLGPTEARPPAPGGYTSATDYTWVLPPPAYPPARYELINGDQVLDDGTVFKFYQLADRSLHPEGFQYKLVGTVLESFSVNPATDILTPAGGTPIAIQDTADSNPIIWGAATLVSGGYIYIYGVKPYSTPAFPLYLARVPVTGLAAGAPWQYDASQPGCGSPTWSTDPGSARPLRTGVSAGFSVTRVNGTYVLLTNDTSTPSTTGNAVAYYAACPTGFAPDAPAYRVFDPRLPPGELAYEYRIVPQFSDGSHVLVSYSLNTTEPSANFADATIYRPRFLDVALPGIPGPSGPVTNPPP